MKKDLLQLAVFFLCLSAFISHCNVIEYVNEDPFYTDGGGIFNLPRFPLIKPYEAINYFDFDKNPNWVIDFHLPPEQRDISDYSIPFVERIAIENGVIMVHSPLVEKRLKPGEVDLHWFIIIPNKKIETGFEYENEFLAYLETYGVQEPDWQDVFDIFHKFGWTWCLDWIPACQ
ncbi:MAG: hypothetical protein IPP55_12780 [Anaerolineales bacterium]|nr:hypothetical protein [Anaerolineales bacterium]